MRIVNADGNELPRDGKSTGEVQVRGPHVVQAYFKVSMVNIEAVVVVAGCYNWMAPCKTIGMISNTIRTVVSSMM